MAEDTPKEVVTRVMQGMADGDYIPLMNAFSNDVKWSVIGNTIFSGVLTGKSEVLSKRMIPFGEAMEAPPVIQPLRYLCEGDRVVVEAEGVGTTKKGKPYNCSYCMIFRVEAGEVVEFSEYFDTDVSVQAFGRKE